LIPALAETVLAAVNRFNAVANMRADNVLADALRIAITTRCTAESTLVETSEALVAMSSLALTYEVAVDLMTVAVVDKNTAVRADVAFDRSVTLATILLLSTDVCALRASALIRRTAVAAEVCTRPRSALPRTFAETTLVDTNFVVTAALMLAESEDTGTIFVVTNAFQTPESVLEGANRVFAVMNILAVTYEVAVVLMTEAATDENEAVRVEVTLETVLAVASSLALTAEVWATLTSPDSANRAEIVEV
jgi:hypothetical protein